MKARPQPGINKVVFIAAGIVMFYLFQGLLWGQNGPFSTNATVSFSVRSTNQQVGREFSVDLIINLNGATGLTGSGSSTPAILGAFLFNVGFVPADFQFIGANNGAATEFTSPPAYTDPTIANSAAFVGILNTQAGTTPHSGAYLVARVRFKPLRQFSSSSLTIAPSAAAFPMSLSSAYLSGSPASGPAFIPFTAGASLAIRADLLQLFLPLIFKND